MLDLIFYGNYKVFFLMVKIIYFIVVKNFLDLIGLEFIVLFFGF